MRRDIPLAGNLLANRTLFVEVTELDQTGPGADLNREPHRDMGIPVQASICGFDLGAHLGMVPPIGVSRVCEANLPSHPYTSPTGGSR